MVSIVLLESVVPTGIASQFQFEDWTEDRQDSSVGTNTYSIGENIISGTGDPPLCPPGQGVILSHPPVQAARKSLGIPPQIETPDSSSIFSSDIPQPPYNLFSSDDDDFARAQRRSSEKPHDNYGLPRVFDDFAKGVLATWNMEGVTLLREAARLVEKFPPPRVHPSYAVRDRVALILSLTIREYLANPDLRGFPLDHLALRLVSLDLPVHPEIIFASPPFLEMEALLGLFDPATYLLYAYREIYTAIQDTASILLELGHLSINGTLPVVSILEDGWEQVAAVWLLLVPVPPEHFKTDKIRRPCPVDVCVFLETMSRVLQTGALPWPNAPYENTMIMMFYRYLKNTPE